MKLSEAQSFLAGLIAGEVYLIECYDEVMPKLQLLSSHQGLKGLYAQAIAVLPTILAQQVEQTGRTVEKDLAAFSDEWIASWDFQSGFEVFSTAYYWAKKAAYEQYVKGHRNGQPSDLCGESSIWLDIAHDDPISSFFMNNGADAGVLIYPTDAQGFVFKFQAFPALKGRWYQIERMAYLAALPFIKQGLRCEAKVFAEVDDFGDSTFTRAQDAIVGWRNYETWSAERAAWFFDRASRIGRNGQPLVNMSHDGFADVMIYLAEKYQHHEMVKLPLEDAAQAYQDWAVEQATLALNSMRFSHDA